MNDAHLHLLINHFPIVGTLLGVLVLLGGVFFKNNAIKNTAYCIFVIAAIFSFLSMTTGDGAEELVEEMPSAGHAIIHEHEEIAEKFAIIMYLLGIVAVIGLITNAKKHPKASFFSYAILVIAIVAVFFASKVGTSGGEIRHTEIRAEGTAQNLNMEHSE